MNIDYIARLFAFLALGVSTIQAAPTTQPVTLPPRDPPGTAPLVAGARAEMYHRFCRYLHEQNPAHVSIDGVLVDQFGNAVDGVEMTIKRGQHYKLPGAEPPPPTSAVSTVSGRFRFDADLSSGSSEWRYAAASFRRKGYYGAVLTLPRPEDMSRIDDRDSASAFTYGYLQFAAHGDEQSRLCIVLQKIEHPAILTPLTSHHALSLWLYPNGMVACTDLDHPDVRDHVPADKLPSATLRLSQPDLPNGRFDWAIQPYSYPPGGQRIVVLNTSLTSGDADIGFQRAKVLDVRRPCRSMGYAPIDGYKSSLPIDDHGFTDECGGISQFNYFFIKIHGKYGRGTVWEGIDPVDKSWINAGVVVWMQPDGSRDLEDGTDTDCD